ncbi:MAG TPA: hypothetical protein VLX67_08150 [Stellaceae bacterium]|nr:hypothetical protein [Stellaceae bacterium]
MRRFVPLFFIIFAIAGCGDTTPGDDSDPTGAYRFSHGRTYGAAAPVTPRPPVDTGM